MNLQKFFRLTFTVIILSALVSLVSCEKEKDQPTDSGSIKIQSLTSADTVLKAWLDTTNIDVVATGENLRYEWSCNHGTLHGSGIKVTYMAGECCVGLNTITCRVFNDSSSVSKDIYIRITSYFEN
jgi:hypothetical protein